jgi:hypothetical protein
LSLPSPRARLATTYYLARTNSPLAITPIHAQRQPARYTKGHGQLVIPCLTPGDTMQIRAGTYNQHTSRFNETRHGRESHHRHGHPGETAVKYTDASHNDCGGLKFRLRIILPQKPHYYGSNYAYAGVTGGTGLSIYAARHYP